MTNKFNAFKPKVIQKTRTSILRFNQLFAQSVKNALLDPSHQCSIKNSLRSISSLKSRDKTYQKIQKKGNIVLLSELLLIEIDLIAPKMPPQTDWALLSVFFLFHQILFFLLKSYQTE